MFSTFTTTADSGTLDDGSFLFDQTNHDLLSLPMTDDGVHLKSEFAHVSGLSNIIYGRESTTSTIQFGGSRDTSEVSFGQLGSKEEGEASTTSVCDGHAAKVNPSLLFQNSSSDLNSPGGNGTDTAKETSASLSYNTVDDPLQGRAYPLSILSGEYQGDQTFASRTPQSLDHSSQPPLTPQTSQPPKPVKSRRQADQSPFSERFSQMRAGSSIPTEISWHEFGRQCILAAENSRLNPFALHPGEYRLLREHINRAQVTIYLNIRNAILRLWHRNPLVYVSTEEAVGCARDKRFFGLAQVAHAWLHRNGYVNFGCVDVPNTAKPLSRRKEKSTRQRTIVVVGAGMSGLGCARHLEGLFAQYGDDLAFSGEQSPKIIILEARPRVGGRIYSHPFLRQAGSTLPYGYLCTAEMGAQIVTGFEHGNPMNTLIRGQLGVPYHGLRDNTILYDCDGTVVERDHDMMVEKLYNDVLERASVYRTKTMPQRTIEGDRNLVMFGREPVDTGGPSISEMEALEDTLPFEDANQAASTTEEKPTSGVEKLAGRAYQLSSGFNPDISAAEAICSMGWKLRPGVSPTESLDLDSTAKSSEFPTLGATMDEGVRQYQNLIGLTPRDMRLINWHHANLEYANAANVNQLSLSGWDQDMGNEFEGEHTEVIGGYQQVPRGLWQCPKKMDVRFSTPIKSVKYNLSDDLDCKPVRIESSKGEVFEADRVIITTSLGVLKSGSITFEPPLPDWKQGVIDRMGFGLLNKVVLVYEEAFWEADRDMFGLLNEAEHNASVRPEDYAAKRGRFYLFWNCLKTSGKPVLVALMAGESAHYAETTSNDQLVKEVTARLASIFGSRRVPLPTETIVTRWRKDPFARGSYSYVGPKTRIGDYDIMAKPHGPVHFAGEATCGTHPATVHGAYLSGLRAAAEVAEAMMGPIKIPTPLIGKKPKTESLTSLDGKRKLEPAVPAQETKPIRVQRDEDYEAEIIAAILRELGKRPVKPGRGGVNPFLLYTKDFWYKCKNECDEVRRKATGHANAKASKQEIRAAIGLSWRMASEEVKKPYMDQASNARDDAVANAADFKDRVATWDKEAARIRKEYIQSNPPPAGNEDLILNSRTAIELGASKRLRHL